MSKLRRVLSVFVIISLCLSIAALAQVAPAGGRGGVAMARGGGGGFGAQADARVQNKTYILEDTNEPMPYSLFVSSKVTKEKEAPLIILLHGLGVDNSFMMRGEVLNLAEEGGYIVAAPLGYTSGGWYGIASMAQAMGGGMGRGTGRGGAPGAGGGRGMGGRGGAPGAGMGGRGMGGRGGAPAGVPNTGVPGAAMANRGGGRGGAVGMRGGAPGGGGMFSFGSSTGGTAVTDPVKVAELSEKDVMNVLEIIRKEYKVDKSRTYLMGHSMGGAGTLYLGVKYAENWAAIGAMAPAAFTLQPASLEKIKDMPVIIVQGDADELVPVTNTRQWVEKMKELKMTYEYKEIPGGDHGGVINDGTPEIFKFFAKHSKSKEN
ncbi:MAG: prolyl oligopeptidase family serine peptidase [Sedimentisphaerales bacterium]|nr:prolyl oligopeptidase family serine peptidase [Sedimentisphaerales bacterium]